MNGHSRSADLDRPRRSRERDRSTPVRWTATTNLRVTVDGREREANWTDDVPETTAALADALPVAGEATRWGDELYFDVPIDAPAENAREVVPEGAIAYWPTGNVLCLFWGPTPASDDDEPRATSPVNVVAHISDTEPLADVSGGARVRLERTRE